MNRIKEHLEQRELPKAIQAVLERASPMPLVTSEGKPMSMAGCSFGLGALIGSYRACGEISLTPQDVRDVCEFLDSFSTPRELRDAIWGPQD
jgi:hypothetical protein